MRNVLSYKQWLNLGCATLDFLMVLRNELDNAQLRKVIRLWFYSMYHRLEDVDVAGLPGTPPDFMADLLQTFGQTAEHSNDHTHNAWKLLVNLMKQESEAASS